MYFQEILNIERKLEDVKVVLAAKKNFSIEAAFLLFTNSTLNKITSEEFKEGLNNLGCGCSISDAKLVILRYDADRDGCLCFWEFSNMFLPQDTKLRQELELKRNTTPLADSKSQLKRVLNDIVLAETMSEDIRAKVKDAGYSLRTVFDQMDWLSKGYLTECEMRRYFDNYPSGTEMLQKKGQQRQLELEALIRRFNKDKFNGRISFPEFLYELTPRC